MQQQLQQGSGSGDNDQSWQTYKVGGEQELAMQQQPQQPQHQVSDYVDDIDDQSWQKYKVGGEQQRSTSAGRRRGSSVGKTGERKSKMFGREPRNKPININSEREKLKSVKQMPFAD